MVVPYLRMWFPGLFVLFSEIRFFNFRDLFLYQNRSYEAGRLIQKLNKNEKVRIFFNGIIFYGWN